MLCLAQRLSSQSAPRLPVAMTFVVLDDDVFAFCVEVHLHAGLLQPVLNVVIQFLRLLGAEMADRTVHKAQICLDGVLADLLDLLAVADTLDVWIRTEFKIDLVGIVNQFLRKRRADQVRQITADLAGQAQLAIRKRARAGKAGRNGAGRLAVDAFAGLRLRAMPFFHRLAFFNQQNLCLALIPQHFKRGENARGARADDNQIEIHVVSPLP